jgi:hypothetical protein
MAVCGHVLLILLLGKELNAKKMYQYATSMLDNLIKILGNVLI